MALSILYLQKEQPRPDYKHQFSLCKIGGNFYWSYTCFITQIDEQLAKEYFGNKKKGIFKIVNYSKSSHNPQLKSFLNHLLILKNLKHPFTKHIEMITDKSKKLFYRID